MRLNRTTTIILPDRAARRIMQSLMTTVRVVFLGGPADGNVEELEDGFPPGLFAMTSLDGEGRRHPYARTVRRTEVTGGIAQVFEHDPSGELTRQARLTFG